MNQHAVLLELIRGRGAHVDASACVTVRFDLAGRTPTELPHSVWQLVFHMTYWMDYELARIDGKAPGYPEHASESWPKAAPESEEHWHQAVAAFDGCLNRMSDLVRAGDEVLGKPVPPISGAYSEQAPTVEGVLWQTVVHNSYHLGQVAQVRRALGAWPPATGGDTW
jgi:uncharacterized damage-inducible protein DinB